MPVVAKPFFMGPDAENEVTPMMSTGDQSQALTALTESTSPAG
jgi:hypothetical protein